MPFIEQIGISSTAVIALLAAVVGFAAFWSNPRRLVNRGFFAASLFVAFWLFCLERVQRANLVEDGRFWAMTTGLAGAAILIPIWFIKEAILNDRVKAIVLLSKGRWWIIACVALGIIRMNNWFVGRINISFWVFVTGLAALYLVLCKETVGQIRFCVGLKRLELQIALLGGSATGLIVMALLVIRTIANVQWVTRLYPIVILLFYSATVVAMTTSRIFNARQLVIVAGQKFVLVTSVAIAGYAVFLGLGLFLPDAIAILLTTAVVLWTAANLNDWLDRVFQFYPEAKIARQAAFTAAQRENRVENLEKAFLSVLRGWGQTDHAIILSGTKDSVSGMGVELSRDLPAMQALRQLIWTTPERLTRERATPSREALATFLTEQQLGVLVMVEGLSLTILVGVGIGTSRRPITYPQVTQLLELASIMESALERAHFSAKVQHTEQLATVGLLGASLAHEIRNPLVSIKTFVQLLPTHHQDPAFREKFFRLIGDEVGRIDQLTEQLLDLASPRTYTAQVIELHPVLRASLDLVAAKAAHRSVQFLTDFQASPDHAFTDASAAKQVMLNLCFNAIQAVEQRDGEERWVRVATRNTASGIEMAVADSGPGISSEIRPRLFQPFQTTKSTGFGLGLAICSDILANLNASITVDPPAPGTGATFRVTFPCQPLSS